MLFLLFLYSVGLQEQNQFFLDLYPKLEAALAFAKEFISPYERMLLDCKAQYGVSMKEQLYLRKRKQNQKKDTRGKQKRQVIVDTEEIVIEEDEKENEVTSENETNEQDDEKDVSQ